MRRQELLDLAKHARDLGHKAFASYASCCVVVWPNQESPAVCVVSREEVEEIPVTLRLPFAVFDDTPF